MQKGRTAYRARPFLCACVVRCRSTAAAAAAGTAAAPIFGGDGKTILHKVDDLIIGKTHHLGIEKYVDIIYLLLRIVII